MRKPFKFVDFTGQQIGCFKVIRLATTQEMTTYHNPGKRNWLVKCGCGREKFVQDYAFKGGRVRCGNECTLIVKETGRGKYPDELATLLSEYRTSKKNALARKGKGFWLLTFEQYITIVKKPCSYCGVGYSRELKRPKIKNRPVNFSVRCVGIDRIDNSKGYILGNCAPCCGDCNSAKMDKTLENFKAWLTRAYTHLIRG